MNEINRREPVYYKQSKIANLLKKKIKASKMKHRELATLCEYKHPNNIAMITTGKSKVALNKIPLFAEALNLDEGFLFNMALKEYDPIVHQLLQRNSIIVSNSERVLIEEFKAAVGGIEHVVITKRSRKLLKAAFSAIAQDNRLLEFSDKDEKDEAINKIFPELNQIPTELLEEQVGDELSEEQLDIFDETDISEEVAADLEDKEIQSAEISNYWKSKYNE